MSFKDKIMNVLVAHPKLVTLGIGLAVTFAITMVIGMVIGMVDNHDAFARQSIRQSIDNG